MPIEDIRARNEALRREGFNPTYPEHSGKVTKPNAVPGAPGSIALPMLEKCPHEGIILEYCTSCGTESRHVRQCELHDVSCTRAHVSDKVRACVNCDDHPTNIAKAKRTPNTSLVKVPQPPPYTGAVTSKCALVTVVAGALGEKLWAVSRPGFIEYANRLGADLVVLTWPGNPRWQMSAKFALGPVIEHYDRLIYADADVLLRPTTLNLFEECQPGELGGVSDLADVLKHDPRFLLEYREVLTTFGFDPTRMPYYLNTGVLVLGREHQQYFSTPTIPVPPFHCTEQHWWVANMLSNNAPVKLMRREANWQWWVDKTMDGAPPEAVLHFSGWDGKIEDRVALMREWAAKRD